MGKLYRMFCDFACDPDVFIPVVFVAFAFCLIVWIV